MKDQLTSVPGPGAGLWAAVAVSLVVWLCGSCASVPYREVAYQEIRSADAVLTRAQQVEAPVYASETYLDALLALRRAKDLMTAEKYSQGKALAEKAKKIAEQAIEETQTERLRVQAQAERLLFRGVEIWNQYEKRPDREYIPEELIEIKKTLEAGNQLLAKERYMDALARAQQSHQLLVRLPEAIERNKVSLLEQERRRQSSRQTAGEILAEARKQAETILAEAREQAEQIKVEAYVSAAKARQDEFERIYPATYKVKPGETLNDIAARREVFNDSFMWPLIYKANRDQIRDPTVVYPGQVLNIPRDLTFEEIIEARKQAQASPPYIPPYDAYNPEFYRRYFVIVPDKTPDEGGEAP